MNKGQENAAAGYRVGASQVDATPTNSTFLYGYPHVDRMSSGVHDPLLASAMVIDDGQTKVVFVGVDVILVPRETCASARDRIQQATGIAPANILISATHTHSGPITTKMVSNLHDPVVPDGEPAYLQQLQDAIVQSAIEANQQCRPATLRQAVADGAGLGTNRRSPEGPAIPQVPVLAAYEQQSDSPIALMCVCTMHPTVLHGDSKLISGDFPGLARRHLQSTWLGESVPIVYHMGAAGNQSPRHVVQHNTFAEAERLGQILSDAIRAAMKSATVVEPSPIVVECVELADLPPRTFPVVEEAEVLHETALNKLQTLRANGAPRVEVRTAETDWFGAQETLTLARLSDNGTLQPYVDECLPAWLQAIRIGPTVWVGWPGEVFVEFALEIMDEFPDASIITLSGGDMQGYLVTQQAVQERAYEAGNAVFRSPDTADRFVESTRKILSKLAVPAS